MTGMVIGTVFTLFIVPSIYVLVARTHRAALRGEQPIVRIPELAEAS